MKNVDEPGVVKRGLAEGIHIAAYAQAQPPARQEICSELQVLIEASLPKATAKIWHGSPVWFIDGNPVVGYNATAKSVNLLFWNGRAIGDPGLKPVGKHGAAQAVFGNATEIDPKKIRRWLEKAKSDVFDSAAYFRKIREEKRRAGS